MAIQYSGNPDYRGWINADPSKQWALNYVGNDGGINEKALNDAFVAYSAAQMTGSGTLSPIKASVGGFSSPEQARAALQGYASAYDQALAGEGGGAGGTGGVRTATTPTVNRGTIVANRIREAMGMLPEEEARSRQRVAETAQQNRGSVQGGYDLGKKNLSLAKTRVGEYEGEAIGELEKNLRSAFDAFRTRVSTVGAGDSSAPGAASRALQNANTTQRTSIKRDAGRQLQDIGLKDESLDFDYRDKMGRINSYEQNTIADIIREFANRNRSLQYSMEDAMAGGATSNTPDVGALVQQYLQAYQPAGFATSINGADFNYNPSKYTVTRDANGGSLFIDNAGNFIAPVRRPEDEQ